MSINKEELLRIMEEIAPANLAEEWDNCGFQIDLGVEPIRKILLALEITNEVIKEAIDLKVDLIITHHPLIFGEFNTICNKDLVGDYIIQLIKSNISVYSAHTNFDSALGGNNDYLADLLNLKNLRSLNDTPLENHDSIGRMGELEKPIKLKDFGEKLKKILNIKNHLSFVGDLNADVSTVGLCTGAGASFIKEAFNSGCSLYLTGDIKYHDAQLAKEIGLNLIDAGHFYTEEIFGENLEKQLKDKLYKKKSNAEPIEIVKSKINLNPTNDF